MSANNTSPPPTPTRKLLSSIGWPGLVITLLAGHATLMMIAVTLGRTIPAALEEVEPYNASAVANDQPTGGQPTDDQPTRGGAPAWRQ